MIKRYAPTAARILLGLIFLVFGVNGFLHFLPMPPLEEPAKAFGGALIATGYMFPLIKVTEIVAAVMLLTGRFVPLGLTLLAPIVVNIAAFHLVLNHMVGMSPLLIGLLGYLAWAYRDSFRGVLAAKATPAGAGEAAAPRAPAGAAPGQE